jgi:hypothetical protein
MNVRNVKNLNVTLVINSGVNRSPTHDNVVRVYPSLAVPQTLYPFSKANTGWGTTVLELELELEWVFYSLALVALNISLWKTPEVLAMEKCGNPCDLRIVSYAFELVGLHIS